LDGQPLKIFTASPLNKAIIQQPGTVGVCSTSGLPVAASDGYVILKDVQITGKKRMPIADFLRGYRLLPGNILG